MTYLSQLVLNPRHRQVQRDLSDCQELHRTVMGGFPDVPEGQSARDQFDVLHRVDEHRPRIVLLVQSSTEPTWAFLPSGYLEAGTSPAVKRVDEAYSAITTGTTLRFRLRANPTKRVGKIEPGRDERWKGKRVDLRREEEQLAWLTRKGYVDPERRGGGFELLSVQVRPDAAGNRPLVSNVSVIPGGTVRGRRREHRLMFGSVLFDGVLRVTDAPAFHSTLINGVGPAKAYGFALLSVGPA